MEKCNNLSKYQINDPHQEKDGDYSLGLLTFKEI